MKSAQLASPYQAVTVWMCLPGEVHGFTIFPAFSCLQVLRQAPFALAAYGVMHLQDCQQYRGPGALDRLVDGVRGLIDRMQPSTAASTVSSASLRPTPQK